MMFTQLWSYALRNVGSITEQGHVLLYYNHFSQEFCKFSVRLFKKTYYNSVVTEAAANNVGINVMDTSSYALFCTPVYPMGQIVIFRP